jgi:hypothetical protein
MTEDKMLVERLIEKAKAHQLAIEYGDDKAKLSAYNELQAESLALSERIDVLEAENAALREKRRMKIVPAPPVVLEDETSLTKEGKLND